MIAVSIVGVTKRFSTTTAVDDVDLDIDEGQFVTLVGPSGCGKTTLLRMIAGLETPTSGEIRLFGTTVFSSEQRTNVQPHARHLGMVFQSYALWPHMTAFDNVAFPLRRAAGRRLSACRARRSDITDRVIQALEMVHCEMLAERYPGEMSGGQQQRVALARAIVGSPRLVLMDEPLSNLDAKLRARLRFELRAIQQELGFTALYVTHDRAEAMSMSDVVVVLRDGHVEQEGPPEEVYRRPASSYVSDFLGDHNLMEGSVVSGDDVTVVLDTALGRTTAPCLAGRKLEAGCRVVAAVARGSVIIGPLPASPSETGMDEGLGGGHAEVAGVGYFGWYSEVLLRLASGEEVTARTEGATELTIGDRVGAYVRAAASIEPAERAVAAPGDDSTFNASSNSSAMAGRSA